MEIIALGYLIGIATALVFIGVGVIWNDKSDKRQSDVDNDIRLYIPERCRCGDGLDGRIHEMASEELAAQIRTIASTGICPSENEKQYLKEAARRLERSDDND